MNALAISSLFICLCGIFTFAVGLGFYWWTASLPGLASGFLIIGLLLIFGAIAILCLAYSE